LFLLVSFDFIWSKTFLTTSASDITEKLYKELESRILGTIERDSERLIQISRTIHSDPEIAYQEFRAAALLTASLEERGFEVERGIAEIETAFVARAGSPSSPQIALLAEYDALPGLGHGCGHNLMATATLGAGWALREVLDQLPGQLAVYGTPAEEGGGGKVLMVNRGIFKKVDAALIFHPSIKNITNRGSLAATRIELSFKGKASHSAAHPEMGINALDAVIQTFNNINALRQHLRPDARVHGIITNGGQAVNIVPEFASASFSVRAADRKYADEVLEKFRRCAEAAALATGATLDFNVLEHTRYDNMVPNGVMARLFAEKLEKLGLEVVQPEPNEAMGSTDMGNVSQVVPSIHAYLAIAPESVSGHSVEFREAAYSDVGQGGMLNAARALALTALDLLAKPELLAAVKREFAEQASKGVVKG
jgi:amidohydrolase